MGATDGDRSTTGAADCNEELFGNKSTATHVDVDPSDIWTTRGTWTSDEKVKEVVRCKLARFRVRRAVTRMSHGGNASCDVVTPSWRRDATSPHLRIPCPYLLPRYLIYSPLQPPFSRPCLFPVANNGRQRAGRVEEKYQTDVYPCELDGGPLVHRHAPTSTCSAHLFPILFLLSNVTQARSRLQASKRCTTRAVNT